MSLNNTRLPLCIKDSDGHLEQMDTADILYLLYGGGKHLASINLPDKYNGTVLYNTTNSTLVGNMVNTYYGAATGSHGTATELQYTETTYPLHQMDGDLISTSKRTLSADSDGQMYEMTNAMHGELRAVAAFAIGAGFPGITFRLSATDPSTESPAEFQLYQNTAFQDSRGGGAITTYKLWRKIEMPSGSRPTALGGWGKPLLSNGIYRTTYNSKWAVFGMTKAEAGVYWAYVWQMLRAEYGIGDYVILSSAQGDPPNAGYGGQWAVRGTAVDTRRPLSSNQNYTGTRAFSGSRPSTEQFTNAGNQKFEGTRQYSADYVRQSQSFVGKIILNNTQNIETYTLYQRFIDTAA